MRVSVAFILLVLTIVLIQSVAATPIALVDSRTGDEITAAFVRVEANGTLRDFLVTPAQRLDLAPLATDALLLVRTNASETFDHYARLGPGPVPQGVPVQPAGLVMGEVRDASDNLIADAPIAITCPTLDDRTVSDGTGRFSAFLPAENCTLAVAAEGRIGSTVVEVAQGAVTRADVNVSARSVSAAPRTESSLLLLIIAVLAALFVAGLILFHKVRTKRRNGNEGEEKRETKKGFIAEEAKGMLKEKEKLVVDELLLRGGKMTLRELRFSTQLPRTSLLRTLEGLEARNILVKKEERGRLTVELLKRC